MNRILLVDLGERELKKRQELRSKLAEFSGLGRKLNANVRYVLVDFGDSPPKSKDASGATGRKRREREIDEPSGT